MHQHFLNIFLLLSLISVPAFCFVPADIENGKMWKEIFHMVHGENGHEIKGVTKLFEPVCGGEYVPNSDEELFTQMEKMQPFLWKLTVGISKMTFLSNHHQQTSQKIEDRKMANNQMAIFHHKNNTDEEKIQEILEKLSHLKKDKDQMQMALLQKIMGKMVEVKTMTMLNQKEKLMKLFHELQVDLKVILNLDKENVKHLKSIVPLNMDILSIIKNGAELIILELNGGNECKNVDKEKAKHNQENTFRLLYLITKLNENDFMQIPAGRKDRRRRRRKRQYSLIIIILIALAFVGAIGLGCFYLNKIEWLKEDSGVGGGENNA